MYSPRTRLGALLGSMLILAACQDGASTPSAPEPADAQASRQAGAFRTPPGQGRRQVTPDDEVAALVDRAPGLGGFYRESADGPLVVRVTDLGRSAAAGGVVRAFLEQRGRAPGAIVFRKADYDFKQLVGWRERINQAPLEGVTLVDVDEVRNRVRIGVLNAGAGRSVRAELARLDLPGEAVVVEEVAPMVMQVSLQQTIRPIAAGMQIQAPGTCTLGGIAAEQHSTGVNVAGPRYLLTNSHCTGSFASVTGTTMGQPTTASPVGTEFLDPPLFTNTANSACPVGRSCRYSDAALFTVNPGVDMGRFGYTAWTNLNSLTFTGYTRFEGHAGFFLSVGDPHHKVGRTTGRTSGGITAICVDVPQFDQDPWGNVFDTGRTMLCQNQANYNSAGGDSGSPVLGQGIQQTTKYWWHGINWGGNGSTAVYSPYRQLIDEMKLYTPGGWEPYFVVH